MQFRRWFKSVITAFLYNLIYRGFRSPSFPVPTANRSVLFVLGSGASVDDLASDHWHTIARSTSVGVNFWTAHTFSPDYYALEKMSVNQYQALEPLLSSNAKTSAARVLWFGGPNRPNRKLLWIFRRLGGSVWFYSGWPLHEGRDGDLRGRFIRLYRLFQHLPRRLRPALDAGHTVSRLVTMAAMNGWKTIVLVGVDLGGSYFEDYMKLREKIESNSNRKMPHAMDSRGRHANNAVELSDMRQGVFFQFLDSWFQELNESRVLDGRVKADNRLGLESFDWRNDAS